MGSGLAKMSDKPIFLDKKKCMDSLEGLPVTTLGTFKKCRNEVRGGPWALSWAPVCAGERASPHLR